MPNPACEKNVRSGFKMLCFCTASVRYRYMDIQNISASRWPKFGFNTMRGLFTILIMYFCVSRVSAFKRTNPRPPFPPTPPRWANPRSCLAHERWRTASDGNTVILAELYVHACIDGQWKRMWPCNISGIYRSQLAYIQSEPQTTTQLCHDCHCHDC